MGLCQQRGRPRCEIFANRPTIASTIVLSAASPG
jgi:hypothetical protein